MATVSYSYLESLAGEILPPRIALSIVNISSTSTSYTTNQFPAQGGGGSGGHGSTVAYACQENDSPAGSGGLLGLFANSQQNTLQCTPAAVSGGG